MNHLYPLKFDPIIKDKIWGGNRLRTVLNKKNAGDKAGESWEISGLEGNQSVVSEGFLAGNNLGELIGIYMGDLVGDRVFDQFVDEFPLLIKFIDANDILSVQVHPDDETAFQRHRSAGKTEMWYIMDREPGAELICGFNRNTGKEEYLEHLESGRLQELLKFVRTEPGDVFFMPAGMVHAIGAGNLLAEIQQSSDVTYRIFDWNRKDDQGNPRELHTDLATGVINFEGVTQAKTIYEKHLNKTTRLVECPYFTTNKLEFNKTVGKDFNLIDSFVIYICTRGGASIESEGNEPVLISAGETVLIPAEIKTLEIVPKGTCGLLEVYIP